MSERFRLSLSWSPSLGEIGNVEQAGASDLRLESVAIPAVSSHGDFRPGELTDEEAIFRRADRLRPARGAR